MNKSSRIHHVVLLLVFALFVLHAIWLASLADDACITFRYARNLVRLGVITWNPGEPPVEGYTNFLWMILCAGAYKLGLALPLFSQVLGTLAGLACVGLVFAYARRELRLPMELALACGGLLALSGPLATWSSGGLETSFFAMLILAGIERFAAYWRTERSRNLILSFFLLFLATLTRPEGFMVWGLLVALAAPLALARPRRHAADLAAAVAAYLVPFLGYFSWRYHYFGYPLPNSFYAKTGGTVYQWLRGLEYSGGFFACFIAPLLLPVVPALVMSKCGMRNAECGMMPGEASGKWHALVWLRGQMALITVGTVTAVYIAYIVYVGGDYMMMFRFFAPIMPLIYLLFGAAVSPAWRSGGTGRRSILAMLLVMAAGGTLLQSTPLEARIFPYPARHHGTYRGVAGEHSERWSMKRFLFLADFFQKRANGIPSSICTDAIGAIGYFTDLTVYDNEGLTDPRISHMQVKDMGKGYAGHEKVDLAYTISKKPSFVMFDRFLHPTPPPEPPFGPEIAAPLKRDYHYVTIKVEDHFTSESGFLAFYERNGR